MKIKEFLPHEDIFILNINIFVFIVPKSGTTTVMAKSKVQNQKALTISLKGFLQSV